MDIIGGCHCGNISFALDWRPEPTEIPARACSCTFCVKHGGVWTACPEGRLLVRVAVPAAVSNYVFRTRTATFHVCMRCGVVPVVTSHIGGRDYAVVNVHAFQGVDPTLLRAVPASFDGEGEAERLARRQRNWIGSVEFLRGRDLCRGFGVPGRCGTLAAMSDDRYAPPGAEVSGEGSGTPLTPDLNRKRNIRRLFAAAMMVGALLCVGIVALNLIRMSEADASSLVVLAAFVALFAWSFFVGLGLWKETAVARRWAPVLFATQVPILGVTGLSASWFSGFTLNLVFTLGTGAMNIHFNLGGGFAFYLGGFADPQVIGVNVFALIAAIWLWRNR